MAIDKVTSAGLTEEIITGQTAETTVANDDLVLLSDTSASAALKKMTVANLVANVGGLSEVDYFTLNDLNVNSYYDYTLTSSNTTRVSSGINASITFTKTGTGVSLDSDGLVTFPSTGTYYLVSQSVVNLLSGSESNYIVASIFGTNNGATGGLTNRAKASGAGTAASSSTNMVGTTVSTFFTVGNTSNDKVLFKHSVSNNSTNVRLYGVDAQEIHTSFLIMKVAG
jgi:hypothetical protein